ncbi:MAG TPA: MFS transporter [Microlunatus sp.]
MFRPYARILRTPHTALPFLSSFLGSLPITMLSLGLLLLIQSGTGSFAQAGLVSGSLSAGNGIGLIVQGRLIDRYGQTAVLIITGVLCGSALMTLTFAASRATPVTVLVFLAGIAGASIPAVITSMRVLIPELVAEPDLRTAGYALLGTQFQLAMISGPLVVSALLVLASPAYAVLIAAGLAVVGGFVFAATPASRRWRPNRSARPADATPLRSLAVVTPGLLTLLIANFGAGLAGGLISVAVPAIAVAGGVVSLAGLLFAAQSAGDILGGFVYGGRDWRLPVPYRLLVCQAAVVVAAALLALTTGHPLAMLPLMFALGLSQAPGTIAGSTLLDVVSRKGALGASYTTLVAASLAGVAIGSSVGGAVLNTAAGWVLFAIAAAATAAAWGQTFWRRRTLSGTEVQIR